MAGQIFVTGHDADSHGNSAYMRAGLDYLAFGQAATGSQIAERSTLNVGYIYSSNQFGSTVSSAGYTNLTLIDVDITSAFDAAFAQTGGTNNFDILVIGSGVDAFSISGVTLLNSRATDFANYFNAGGSLFVQTDEGRGQSFYNFIPSFGSTNNNAINSSGAFSVTPAGTTIGLTESIVDADLTHSYYSGVDTSVFTVFETFNSSSLGNPPVAFGLRQGTIDDDGGGFSSAVPEPASVSLLGIGALSLFGAFYRRRNQAV